MSLDIKSYKKGSKTLYSCRFWYFKNGNKKSKYKSGFEKKKDAENWGIDTKRLLKGLNEDADETTVRDFLDKWIKTKKDKLSPTTFRGYETNINHINKYIGNTKLMKLKLIDIQSMADSLSSSGKKYKTVKYVCRTLHAALEYALKNDMVTKNVSKGVEIAEDEEKFKISVYTADDLGKLISLLREQKHFLYIPVLLASMRGLRRGECLGLRWSDVDFDNNIIHVRNNFVVVKREKIHKKVKTKESERTVSIEGFLAQELKKCKKSTNSIYVNEINGQLPDPSHISKRLRSFQEVNELPVCRFHDLRHTFAVLQLECGTDLDTLKRLLGHSKISITSDIYLHENKTLIKKAANKIDNLVFMPQKKRKI